MPAGSEDKLTDTKGGDTGTGTSNVTGATEEKPAEPAGKPGAGSRDQVLSLVRSGGYPGSQTNVSTNATESELTHELCQALSPKEQSTLNFLVDKVKSASPLRLSL